MKDQDKYFEIGKKIVLEAGDFLLKNFEKKHKVSHKTDYHYGIDEDIELNEMYSDYFRKNSPEASLYTEEGEKDLEGKLVWVIDPIEGTSNYRVGNPFYATQICLLENSDPVISIVYAPTLKQMFQAKRGKGSYLNDKKIKVSEVRVMNQAMLSIGKGTKYDDLLWYGGTIHKIIEHVRTFRHFGACGLDMSYLAAGMLDIYMNKGSNRIYDYSPGSLIVKEAGGLVTDFDGNTWNIEKDDILATNRYLNKEFISLLKI